MRIDYRIQLADNGITVQQTADDPDSVPVTEVCEFADKGGVKDAKAVRFFGEHIWADISEMMDKSSDTLEMSVKFKEGKEWDD